ncbi:MAG: response regulator receiver protein [Verrucomicrobiaceae bacterium]|nr:response regulator receiver protein [Verrucomicrobiaceae bacterium]
MNNLGAKTLQKLLGAAEVLHAHGHGSFHERLFQAVQLLYEGTSQGFEVFGLKKGTHTIETSLPFPEHERDAFNQRTGELVQQDHPLFPLLMEGFTETVRMSDLISKGRLLHTDLYNEIFKIFDIESQIAIPFTSADYAGGLTINRDRKDFTDEELAAARVFSRHMLIAYRAEQLLNSATEEKKAARTFDFTRLRRAGLTRRECEVLWWAARGKRDGEIAVILGMSPRTASGHMRSILAKLGVETRTAAAAAAFAER